MKIITLYTALMLVVSVNAQQLNADLTTITPIVTKLINDIYKDDIKLWNNVNKYKKIIIN